MESVRKTIEDFEAEVRIMGGDEETVKQALNGFMHSMFFSSTGMATLNEELKENIRGDMRKNAILYLRAIKKLGAENFDPEKISFNGIGDETFEHFSDVNWDVIDDDSDYDDYYIYDVIY